MAQQESLAKSKRDVMADGARYIVGEILRQPVKDAVKEALDEEAAVVRSDDGEETPATDRASGPDRSRTDGSEDSSGGSRTGLVLLSVAAALGAAYLVRKRRSDSTQTTWSEFDEEGVGEPGPNRTERESESIDTEGTTAGGSQSSTATTE